MDPPASGDTAWAKTTGNGDTFTFRADRVDSARVGAPNTATQLHTFVIKAVDGQGMPSAPDWRSFNAFTLAPSAKITYPTPHNLLFPRVAPSVAITWTGTDPDGPGQRPRQYKFILLKVGDPLVDFADLSKLNRFGPEFAGWDSVSGDTTLRLYEDLAPDQRYVFILTALDEAGAWDPVFNQRTNVLVFSVSWANQLGPIITLFNEYFNFTYPSGGYNKEYRPITVEVPADLPVTMNWTAKPTAGYYVKRYRWAVDIADLADETPRSDQNADIQHWSYWTTVTTTTFGPFSPPPGQELEGHVFYLEAEDNVGLRSLGVVQMSVVRPALNRSLLIVDDRRGTPDRYPVPNKLGPPPGPWPSEAELDTLYFARGGFPWQGYGPENGLPAQLLSPPGLFLGYAYDTLDTRNGADANVPLSVLGRYLNVIWYTDKASADMSSQIYDVMNPITSLREMTAPNGFNSIGIYLRYGGRLLMFGGGIVSATMRAWGDLDADFKASPPGPTLKPGMFPHQVLHMRADMRQVQGTQIQVSPRRPAWAAGLTSLAHRSQGDPLPPLRDVVPAAPWMETVVKPLRVIEDVDPDPDRSDSVSVLDTLYVAAGGSAVGTPAGFYYHGTENPPVIYLGFDLWMWRRSQLIQTIDFFLQNVWGLPREPLPRDPTAAWRPAPTLGAQRR